MAKLRILDSHSTTCSGMSAVPKGYTSESCHTRTSLPKKETIHSAGEAVAMERQRVKVLAGRPCADHDSILGHICMSTVVR